MQENRNSNNDEITLKELLIKLGNYISEVIKFWWVIGIACVLSVAGFYYMHINHIPSYQTELRFVVEGQNGGGGGLSSLLGSIGIKRGGRVNPFKIIEVGKSSDILLEVLSEKHETEGNLANAIIAVFDLEEEWSEVDSRFDEFRFGDSISTSGTLLERSAIKRLRSIIWGSSNRTPLTTYQLDEETGIYSIVTSAKEEQISLLVTTTLYAKIKNFFEEEVFINQKQLADILTAKADSIKVLNESKVRQLAIFEDTNRGTISNQTMVTRRILSQENLALTSAYAEVLKSKEMTDVNLKDMQPLFMAIDTPFSPIAPSRSTLVSTVLKGILLGGFLSVIFILLRKIYRDIMHEEKA